MLDDKRTDLFVFKTFLFWCYFMLAPAYGTFNQLINLHISINLTLMWVSMLCLNNLWQCLFCSRLQLMLLFDWTIGRNQNTWSHRTQIIFREINIIFHPFGSLVKTSEALGTHHLPATVTMLLRMRFLNVWDNVPIDLKYVCQQYFTCMCFLGFIRYNKTFIACGFRKYENVFTHEYHIPLGRCPHGIWYSWVNKFSYFPHQHAINE
jgi:hypothetical protein